MLFLCFGLCLEFGVLCYFLCSNSCAFSVLWFVLGVWSFVLFLVLKQLCFFCASVCAPLQLPHSTNLGDFRELCSGLCLEFGVLCFFLCSNSCAFFVLWFVLGVWSFVLFLVLEQLCFFCALVCAWSLEFCAISCAQTVVLSLCFGLCLEFGVLCYFLCSNSCAFFVPLDRQFGEQQNSTTEILYS